MIYTIDNYGEIDTGYAWFNVRTTDAAGDRFIHHAKNGMMIISACRGGLPRGKKYEEFTDEEKVRYRKCVQRSEELKADIRREGLGFIPTLGGYPESYADRPGTVDVVEFSFVVPRRPEIMDEVEFVEFALELCKKYDQDSVLISGISFIANGASKLLDRNANILTDVTGTSDPKVFKKEDFDTEVNPYFTQLKKDPGTTFVIDDSKNMKLFDYYFGTHSAHGQGGHISQAKSGELNPISGEFLNKEYNK